MLVIPQSVIVELCNSIFARYLSVAEETKTYSQYRHRKLFQTQPTLVEDIQSQRQRDRQSTPVLPPNL